MPSRDGLVLDWSIPSAGQIPESASNLDTWTAQYGENLMGDDDSAGFGEASIYVLVCTDGTQTRSLIGFISGSSMDGESTFDTELKLMAYSIEGLRLRSQEHSNWCRRP